MFQTGNGGVGQVIDLINLTGAPAIPRVFVISSQNATSDGELTLPGSNDDLAHPPRWTTSSGFFTVNGAGQSNAISGGATPYQHCRLMVAVPPTHGTYTAVITS